MVGVGIREFVYDMEGPEFLKRELVGFVPIHTFQEHLTCFSNVKGIKFHTLKMVHQVGGFRVGKGGDWDRTGWMGNDLQ